MRIERLDLHSYGHFRDLGLDLGGHGAGLSVVYGPNEAGKSTAMRAIAALLYGIPLKGADHHGLGRHSMRIGARLTSSSGAAVEWIRMPSTKAPLVDLDGTTVNETRMTELLGGTDRSAFGSLFHFGHEELAARSEELLAAEGDLGRLIFSAGLGSERLDSLSKRLAERASKLFRPKAPTSEIHRQLSVIKDMHSAVRAERVTPEQVARTRAELESVQRQITVLDHSVEELRVQGSRLDRLAVAAPLLARRRQHLGTLAACDVSLPSSWATRCERLLGEYADAVDRRTVLEADLAAKSAEIDGIEVDRAALEARPSIEVHVQAIGRYENDVDEIRKAEDRLDGSTQALANVTARMGLEDHEVAALVAVTDPILDAFDSLAERHSMLRTNVETANNEVARLQDEIAELEVSAHEDVDLRDTEIALSTLSAAESGGDFDGFVTKSRAAVIDAEAALREALAALRPRRSPGVEVSVEQTQALVWAEVPSPEEIDKFAARRQDCDALLAAASGAAADAADAVERAVSRVADLETRTAAATAEQLSEVRQQRDSLWADIRAGAALADLGDDYEQAVRRADQSADDRFSAAAVVAEKEQALRDLDQAERRSADKASALDDARRGREAVDGEWAAAWEATPFQPPTMDSVFHGHLKRAAQQLEAVIARRDEAADALERRAAALVDLQVALATLGDTEAVESVSAARHRLGRRLDRIEDSKRARAERQSALAIARKDLARQQAVLERLGQDESAWRGEFAEIARSLGASPESSFHGVRARRRAVRDVRAARAAISEHEGRLHRLRREASEAESRFEQLIRDAGPDLVGTAPAVAVATLSARANAAVTAAATLERLEAARAAAAAEMASLEAEMQGLRTELGLMAKQAGIEDAAPGEVAVAQLGEVVSTIEHRGAIEQELTRIESDLIDASGGQGLDRLVAEADEFAGDPDRLAAARKAWEDEWGAVSPQRDEWVAERTRIEHELQAVDGSDQAANDEQQLVVQQAGLRDLVDEYVRVVLSKQILDDVVARFAEEHQGPILAEASSAFAALTNNAFTRLRADRVGGRPVLLAERGDGEVHETSTLSSGTRDQLYLAVRLAGLLHHIELGAEALPLVLDDLLINFDDERARSAMRLLAAIGSTTQVILFTHQRSMVDLARDHLAEDSFALVELPSRGVLG